ncbi:tetratricopeptide repeat protein, partial [bacterium]
MKFQTLRICLSASLLLGGTCGPHAFAAPKTGVASSRQTPLATVQTLLGAATIRSANANAVQALRLRRALYVGDIVATGAKTKLTLLFQDGAQVRLRENTAVQIQSPSAARGQANLLRVLGGEIWARLRPGNVLETRTAALGVLGTEIRLAATDDTSTLTVIEGAVDFHNNFGAVTVSASQQSVARQGQAPTQPLAIENAGFTVSWSFDLDRAVLPREQFYVSLNRQTVESELQKRRTLAAREPRDANIKRDLGDVLFDARNFEDALLQYTEAETLASNDPNFQNELQVRRGNVLLELQRPDDARAAFALALGTLPSQNGGAQLTTAALEPLATTTGANTPQDEARAGLAWLELFNNRPQAALKWADGVAPSSGGATPVIHDTALAKEATTTTSPELLLARGVSALRAGQNEAATESLRSLSQMPSRWR